MNSVLKFFFFVLKYCVKVFFNKENLTNKVDPGLVLKNGWHLGV